jgi:RNA polymerase sigma-70 factor (ECF subfamily)
VDDRDLLERLRGGDQAAFDAIFRAYYAPLVSSAEAVVRSRAVAEEIVQDIMLVLWRRRETFAVDESLRAYLYKGTRNRALNQIRHERVRRRAEPFVADPPSAPAAAPAELDDAEIAAAVRNAVDDLPPRCREVFELSRTHGLRYAEIATTLGISVKTVEAQMGKALRVLREKLAPWLPQE